jgi:lipid A 4'-phosphatase
MTLQSCKYPSEHQDASLSSPPDKPATKYNLSNLVHGIFIYVIKTPAIWIPLLLLLATTIFFRFTDVDLLLSRPFFISETLPSNSDAHWPLRIVEPWNALYHWGIYPAWIIGAGGLLVFLTSFVWTRLKPCRDAGLFFALMLALGPGLLINGVVKPCWGRPRPHGTIPFGGTQQYVPVGDMGTGTDGASFPSGHASMGFYLMAPAFVLYRCRPRLAAMFLALGLAGGITIGMARIVAGSHFASDVVWSAGIVYFTGLGLAALFRFGEEKSSGFRVQDSE